MSRRLLRVVALAGSAAFAAGCSTPPREVAFKAPSRGLTCDVASANVMTFGRATARLNADLALKHQISDLHGYMFASGLRRIQLVQRTNECVPAMVGGAPAGLYQCTARAQLCGR
jgi:hypothetical protein